MDVPLPLGRFQGVGPGALTTGSLSREAGEAERLEAFLNGNLDMEATTSSVTDTDRRNSVGIGCEPILFIFGERRRRVNRYTKDRPSRRESRKTREDRGAMRSEESNLANLIF